MIDGMDGLERHVKRDVLAQYVDATWGHDDDVCDVCDDDAHTVIDGLTLCATCARRMTRRVSR